MGRGQPFRPTRPGRDDAGPDERTPDERLHAVYEFCAAEYGWTARKVEQDITDEQLYEYFISADARIERKNRNEYEAAIEANRIGYIIARDADAFRRYQRMTTQHGKGQGLTGADLERAIDKLAMDQPHLVVYA